MRDSGEHGARARFRDGIRGQARKVQQEVDQVALATVARSVGNGKVEVTFDDSRHRATVGWSVPFDPEPGSRVVAVGLQGGQEWWVLGVLNHHPVTDHGDRLDQLSEFVLGLDARVTALENR